MWYQEIVDDQGKIPDFIDYYTNELITAKKEVKIAGRLETHISNLPGITEKIFSDLQEIEAVLNYLNIQARKIRRKHFQAYLEGYARQLSSRDVEKYVDGEQEVVDFDCIINSVALVRNQYLGVIKALEQKSFMLGHIARLRSAGFEDITI